jgi:ribonuclease P protein component
MLAKSNRVARGADFRAAMRGGRRSTAPHLMVHVAGSGVTRFGFVIPKSVGGAVVRNRVRRQLRAIGRDLLADRPMNGDVVVRVLPGAAGLDSSGLRSEFVGALERGDRR